MSAKCPGTCRTRSCVTALAPSRLSEAECTPWSASIEAVVAFRSAETDGATASGTPRCLAYALSSNRSARCRQSPPVRISTGVGRPASPSSSMRALPSSVVSSPGAGEHCAVARQCTQASGQAFVVSQKTGAVPARRSWPGRHDVRPRRQGQSQPRSSPSLSTRADTSRPWSSVGGPGRPAVGPKVS